MNCSEREIYDLVKRIFDMTFASAGLVLLFPPMIVISVAILVSSSGPVIFWSERVGRNGTIFQMPKFRSMKIDTPLEPTDRIKDPHKYITRVGDALRKYSLDELPQLLCVVTGQMSLVGPRPALSKQHRLLQMREESGVNSLKPGVTGLAQINGRDNLNETQKVYFDIQYLQRRSVLLDFTILLQTIPKMLGKQGVEH